MGYPGQARKYIKEIHLKSETINQYSFNAPNQVCFVILKGFHVVNKYYNGKL